MQLQQEILLERSANKSFLREQVNQAQRTL